jgi:hypothetical protein
MVWLKAKIGMDVDQGDRELSFCAHALQYTDRVFVVPDASEDTRLVLVLCYHPLDVYLALTFRNYPDFVRILGLLVIPTFASMPERH